MERASEQRGAVAQVTTFQLTALVATGVWLAAVLVRFRRSNPVLIGGLVVLGLYTLAAMLAGKVSPATLGLARSWPWPQAVLTLVWLALMVAWSPVADRVATRWFKEQPNLASFKVIQQSGIKLIAGVIVAWLLGGVLEELVFRGLVLTTIESLLFPLSGRLTASAAAVLIAAIGAGVIHLYQGPRAMLVIVQLSILFGVLFVLSGHNLYSVIACHGLYDTIAFVRFAGGKSRYAQEGS